MFGENLAVDIEKCPSLWEMPDSHHHLDMRSLLLKEKVSSFKASFSNFELSVTCLFPLITPWFEFNFVHDYTLSHLNKDRCKLWF